MRPAQIVDVYCRTSTSSSEDNARLEEQEDICRQYCTALGLTVSEVHREMLSGRMFRERQALNRMRSRYLDGTIQGVVVTNLNILSQSNLHLVMLVGEMEEHQVTLNVVQDRLEDSVQGKWLLALSAFLRAIEREKLLEL